MSMMWQARLANENESQALYARPNGIMDFVNSAAESRDLNAIDLGQEWHAVHYLLTGSPAPSDSPLGLIMGISEPVGEDLGYGPAFYIPPPYITAFDHAISAISNADLKSRYDVDAMIRDDVYIAEGLKSDGDNISLQFLLKHIDNLRAFVSRGAAKSLGAFRILI